jgi:hypothetical protein
MSKPRIFVSGDRAQNLYRFRNHLAHADTFNFDLLLESRDGKMIVGEVKHHGTSAEHIVPRAFFIRGAGSSSNLVKPSDEALLIMPEIGQQLLPFILPKKLRAAMAGDLAEDFRTFAAQWGRPYALRWLWWELGGLCIRRFGPTAIITAIGIWFRQKFGW